MTSESDLEARLRRAEEDRDELMLAIHALRDGIDRTLRTAAHDLRNPLAAVKGFAGLLDKAADEAQATEMRTRIGSAAERALGMVDDMLESVRKPDRGAEVDLGVVVTDVLTVMAQRLDTAGATVEVRRLPTVRGIARSWTVLFENLLDNALTFSRPGADPTVSIEGVSDGRFWEIRVCDNGLGVPEDARDTVFRAGYRLERDEHLGSTGIGLTTVEAVVRQHEGSVRVEGAEGGGTCVVIDVPGKADG